MHRGPNTRKLDLFKSKLHMKLESKKLQAPFLFTWVFLSSLETLLPCWQDISSSRKKGRVSVCKQMKRPHPALAEMQSTCCCKRAGAAVAPSARYLIQNSPFPPARSNQRPGGRLSGSPAPVPSCFRSSDPTLTSFPATTSVHWLTGSVLARCH